MALEKIVNVVLNVKANAAANIGGKLADSVGGQGGAAGKSAGQTGGGMFKGIMDKLGGAGGAVAGGGGGGLGSLLGGGLAAAGPIGAVVAAVTNMYTQASEGVKKVLHGDVLGALTSFVGAVNPVAGALLGVFEGIVKGITSQIISLASIASPAAGERFNRALADIYGVIGQRLVPILDLFTTGTRLLGDVLHTILPSVSSVRQMFEPFNGLFVELRGAFAELAPLLKDSLVPAFTLLAINIAVVAHGLTLAVRGFRHFYNTLAEIVEKATFGKMKMRGLSDLDSSFGAAGGPKPSSFVGIEDLARRGNLAAFSSGTEPFGGIPKKIDDTNAKLGIIVDVISGALKGTTLGAFFDILGQNKAIRGAFGR